MEGGAGSRKGPGKDKVLQERKSTGEDIRAVGMTESESQSRWDQLSNQAKLEISQMTFCSRGTGTCMMLAVLWLLSARPILVHVS